MFSFFKKKNTTPTLFYHTDIHSHVLPGIDDGSKDIETSMFLIEKMRSWGIEKIITTPHVTQDTFENTPDTIRPAFESVKNELKNRGLNIEIHHSAEYRMDEFFAKTIKENQIVPLPNNYILVENSYIQAPWDMDEVLFNLKLSDYAPILAHPERYRYYWHLKNRYKEIHDAGTLFQVNLLSFSGYYGPGAKEIANWMLDNKMIDFIGTDLHNEHHVECIEKFLASSEAKKIAKKIDIKNDLVF